MQEMVEHGSIQLQSDLVRDIVFLDEMRPIFDTIGIAVGCSAFA